MDRNENSYNGQANIILSRRVKNSTRKKTPSENYNQNSVHWRCLHFRDVHIPNVYLPVVVVVDAVKYFWRCNALLETVGLGTSMLCVP